MFLSNALIFRSKCTKICLAAGFWSNLLGEVKHFPRPLAIKRGHTSKRREREEKGEGKTRGRKGKGEQRDPLD